MPNSSSNVLLGSASNMLIQSKNTLGARAGECRWTDLGVPHRTMFGEINHRSSGDTLNVFLHYVKWCESFNFSRVLFAYDHTCLTTHNFAHIFTYSTNIFHLSYLCSCWKTRASLSHV